MKLERSGGTLTVGPVQPVRRRPPWKKSTRQMATSSLVNPSVATCPPQSRFSLLPLLSFPLRTRIWIRWDNHGEHFEWRDDGLEDPWSVLYVFDSSMPQPSLIFQSRQESVYQCPPR